jgi:hypothetical protein
MYRELRKAGTSVGVSRHECIAASISRDTLSAREKTTTRRGQTRPERTAIMGVTRLAHRRRYRVTIRMLLFALSLLLWSDLPAVSKGSNPYKDDPWNPQHIDNLPVEIRQYIARICGGAARAQHNFATYSPREKRWRLNLEYLQCNGLGESRRGSQCLNVDFVAVDAHFRLARKQYANCDF